MICIKGFTRGQTFEPLQTVTITGAGRGTMTVRDGEGVEYVSRAAKDPFRFRAAGALGNHLVTFEDEGGNVIETVSVPVDCRTSIRDAGKKYGALLDSLYWTMVGWHGEAGTIRYKGTFYNFFVRWLRDHVHTMKGMKYFYPELKSGIDLYADSQRADGMIWDNVYPRTPEKGTWDLFFEYGGFIRSIENGTYEFKRIPVENDVEFLFLEGLYYTWKATGDDAWMAGLLDNALKAVKYATSDAYRWSKKYQLLKRGFTIDTWDFQAAEDAAITGHPMKVYKDKTRFGVMFGDNTGMAVGCTYLAEMLAHAGRTKEAERVAALGDGLKKRLDRISWNGRFYTHHVPEDKKVRRDLGVDLNEQVSLSNAYSLNRRIDHEQCVAIIKTYQRIRKQMPNSSPGEWYAIYPPFERGYGGHNSKWEYMNGGVTPIVAGELAHGAFEHGFEEYGVDILDRVQELAARHNDYLHCSYRGAALEEPKRTFGAVDLAGVANVDFKSTGAPGVPGWTGEGINDLARMPTGRQEFNGIPFEVINPARNARKACVGLSGVGPYLRSCTVPVGATADSIYFLHTMAGGPLAGTITLRYADGTSHVDYVRAPKIGNWWTPQDARRGKGVPASKVAWRGPNGACPNVGVYEYGMNNPRPADEIASIEFGATETGTKWFVLAITLCDAPAYFDPGDVSFGIPDNWGAAAVVYALIEGLAGIKDDGVAFDRAILAPRWTAAGVEKAAAIAKYEASGGYLAYTYAYDNRRKTLTIEYTGNGDEVEVQLLLPSGKSLKSMTVDGVPYRATTVKVEKSAYACALVGGIGVHSVVAVLK